MKKVFLVFSILFFIQISFKIYSQSPFQNVQWQNPAPTGNHYYGSFIVNEDIAYFWGAFNLLLKTTNGGNSWDYRYINSDKEITSIHFTTENNGIAVGDDGLILKTTNGGNDWEATGNYFPVKYNAIYFIDQLIGYAVGNSGVIIKTIDGGSSWNLLFTPYSLNFTCLKFINPNTGLVGGTDGRIVRTTDGGITWTSVNQYSYVTVTDLFYKDNLNVLALLNIGTIINSIDGGQSWNTVYTAAGHATFGYGSISFANELTGYALGVLDLKTTNGGANWFYYTFDLPGNFGVVDYNRINFKYNSGTGYISGGFGVLGKTTDFGQTWSNMRYMAGASTLAVSFINSLTGFSCGYNGSLIKTTNGGEHWYPLESGVNTNLIDITFINDQTGFICGGLTNQSTVIKSTNGGEHWFSLPVNQNKFLFSIDALSENLIISVGSSGEIIKSTDGGQSWESKISNTNLRLSSVEITDGFTIYAAGDKFQNSILLKSTDAGESWFNVNFPTVSGFLSDISFINSLTGFAAGNHGKVYKTVNGGANWISVNPNFSSEFISIKFFNENQGMVLDKKNVFLTSNAGQDWTSIPLPESNYLNDFAKLDNNNLIVAGFFSNIFKISGVTLVSEGNQNLYVPDKFNLFQNYPNPFNPVTKIGYEIPVTGNVKLNVYDVTGRKIATLVNEVLTPGYYTVEFNASDISSGIYFYRLVTDKITITKKMMVVR